MVGRSRWGVSPWISLDCAVAERGSIGMHFVPLIKDSGTNTWSITSWAFRRPLQRVDKHAPLGQIFVPCVIDHHVAAPVGSHRHRIVSRTNHPSRNSFQHNRPMNRKVILPWPQRMIRDREAYAISIAVPPS